MKIKDYDKAIEQIQASHHLKNKIILKLENASQERSFNHKSRSLKINKLAHVTTVVICAAIIILMIFSYKNHLQSNINPNNNIPTESAGHNNVADNSHTNNDQTNNDQPGNDQTDNNQTKNGLPIIPLGEIYCDGGFEGLLAYSIDELQTQNPWREDISITTLPVYKNVGVFDIKLNKYKGLSEEEMKDEAKKTATYLGEQINNISAEYGINSIIADCDNLKIQVYPSKEIVITFNPPTKLPQGYSFTRSENDISQRSKTLDYLIKQYSNIVDMEKPVQSISCRYDCYGIKEFDYKAFDGSGDYLDQILGYNFDRINFYPDDDGNLFLMRRKNADLSQKIGDYPAISVEEARQLLLNKRYLTSVPFDLPGEEYIAKVELIYRDFYDDEYHLPYYKFWVELPEQQLEIGLKTFGAYYVPAIKLEYFSEFPDDWNFN